MTQTKIGLILCHEADLHLSSSIPRNVIWTYETNYRNDMWYYNVDAQVNKFGYRKFDYIVNYNCYTHNSERFFNNPYSILKPDGIYIHIDGVLDILNLLDLSIESYRRKEHQTLEAVATYLEKFKYELGFNHWEIPGFFLNNSISTNIHYSTVDQSVLGEDVVYEIARNLDYDTLINLCRSNQQLLKLCQSPTSRFRELFVQIRSKKLEEAVKTSFKKYLTPINALFKALYKGDRELAKKLLSYVSIQELFSEIYRRPDPILIDIIIELVNPDRLNAIKKNSIYKLYRKILNDPDPNPYNYYGNSQDFIFAVKNIADDIMFSPKL